MSFFILQILKEGIDLIAGLLPGPACGVAPRLNAMQRKSRLAYAMERYIVKKEGCF